MSHHHREIINVEDIAEDSDVEFVEAVTKAVADDDCIIVEELNMGANKNTTASNKRPRINEDGRRKRLAKKINTQSAITQTAPESPQRAGLTCCVCYENHSSVKDIFYSTLCGHIYCNCCIEKIMKMNKLCAVCRKKLTKKQYHRIFLS